MKTNFSEITKRHARTVLFLLLSILEILIFSLFLLLFLLYKIFLKEEKLVVNSQIVEIKSRLNSLEIKVKKQQTGGKQDNQICLLEQEINSGRERLQLVPPKAIPIQQHTLLAIDSANLDRAAKTLGIRVNYERLKRYLNSRFGSLEARIYVGEFANNLKQQAWFKYLEQNGYVLNTKPVAVYGDTVKANVDVNLALDVAKDGAKFKKVVLCSGDGDFLPLVRQLQKQGVKVIVLNLPEQTNHHLRKVADEYISLREIKDEIGDRQQA